MTNTTAKIGGVAIGSQIGPIYASVCRIHRRTDPLRIHWLCTPITQALLYIDDVVGAAKYSRIELEDSINYVYSIQTSVYYKETDTHNYLHHTSLHPYHCKQAISYSQFLRLRRICSDDDDFEARATELMKAFFQARGYPDALLNEHLRKISAVSRNEALRPPAERDATKSRVPLILTYNQFNTGMRQILLDNFEILLSDPTTRTIFSELPLVRIGGTGTSGSMWYTLPTGATQMPECLPADILAA